MSRFFRAHLALPQDHGAWVFLLSPLIIGLAAGGRWTIASGLLCAAALLAFLVRQPVTMAVKALSGRRPRADLGPALLWTALYGLALLAALAGLIAQGATYILWLALPAVPVFAWHLWLVSRRAERRKAGVEILAAGVLALAAPAAFWIGRGGPHPDGWLLWLLTWLQAAASIVHAYLRLAQRELAAPPPIPERLRMARRALTYTGFNFLLTLGMGLSGFVSPWLFLPYLLQFGETVYGTLRPAIGLRPTRIGLRQLLVSTLFTVLFVLVWRMP